MREGGKKRLRKKNIEPIFRKVIDQIKKTFDIFKKGDEKKQAKKIHRWKNICYLSKLTFFGMFF